MVSYQFDYYPCISHSPFRHNTAESASVNRNVISAARREVSEPSQRDQGGLWSPQEDSLVADPPSGTLFSRMLCYYPYISHSHFRHNTVECAESQNTQIRHSAVNQISYFSACGSVDSRENKIV